MEYDPLPPPPERTEEEIQRAVARIQYARNIAKLTEVLRRHVPDCGGLSDRVLVEMTYRAWIRDLAQPLIDPNE